MNEYERARRAIAEQRLEEAMVIIDATFHALSRVRAVLVGIGKFLSGAFMRRRDYSKNGVVHFD
jgi:hypothetical protein